MAQPALKYYVTSERPDQVEELRTNISSAADAPALLAAAYTAGLPAGADFWAAASVDYPSPAVWFHTQRPLETELLEQQTAEINRQVSLVRSHESELPIALLRPLPVVATVQKDAEPVASGLPDYRDCLVFAATRPQALIRVGSLGLDRTLKYPQLAPLIELVGVNLGVIARNSGSLETVQNIASRQNWQEEEFFELLEMALAEVHHRHKELSLVVIQVRVDDDAAIQVFAEDHWQQVWELVQDNLRELDLSCQMQPGYYVVAMLATSPREAMIAADRLRGRLEDFGRSYGVKLAANIGISNWSAGRPGVGQLLWEARQAVSMAAASHAQAPFVYA